MILYKKNGEFLGIGKEELSFLGYEDLEEFKSINDDVADLFVNRPGYIFKFKNFSWIDYTLHSGAPKKSVILKLKTGNEVETAIKIKELFLSNPEENEDIYYCLEFSNTMAQSNSIQTESFIQSTPAPSFTSSEPYENEKNSFQKIEKPQIEMPSFDQDFEETIEDKMSFDFNESSIDEEENKIDIKDDFAQDIETKIDIKDDFDQDYVVKKQKENEKIKIDIKDDFAQDIETKIDIKDDFTQDYVVEEQKESEKIKIDIKDDFAQDIETKIDIKDDFSQDYVVEEQKENEKIKIEPKNEENFIDPAIPAIKPKNELTQTSDNLNIDQKQDHKEDTTKIDNTEEEIEEFDLLNCVEEIGLDIGLVSELLTDYIKKLDQSIPIMKEAIIQEDQELLEHSIYKLKGISDNLHIKHLSNKLVSILNSKDNATKTEEVDEFEKIVTKFKGEFI